MLPGTLCDARLYAPVLERLGARAAVPELAGADTVAAMAKLILANASAHISLCGFSLGAIVALEIVRQAPERVERLALIGCNPGMLDTKARTARAAVPQADFGTQDDLPLVHLMAHEASSEVYHQQTTMTLSRADSRDRLSRIDMPTLVLCGARDRVCPPEMSLAIAKAIPRARLVIVPSAGHYLPIERPDAVAEELAAWLATPTRSTR